MTEREFRGGGPEDGRVMEWPDPTKRLWCVMERDNEGARRYGVYAASDWGNFMDFRLTEYYVVEVPDGPDCPKEDAK